MNLLMCKEVCERIANECPNTPWGWAAKKALAAPDEQTELMSRRNDLSEFPPPREAGCGCDKASASLCIRAENGKPCTCMCHCPF